jgi:HlyD family secretion protein
MSQSLVKKDASIPQVYEGRVQGSWSIPTPPPLRQELRGAVLWVFLLVLLFFGVGGGWAATARLAGAVIVPGFVSPENRRQTVQHLEGGIIRAIHVTDGDQVRVGDSLMSLEDVNFKANSQSLKIRLIAFAVQEARATAERNRQDRIDFTHPILADRSDRMVRDAIEQEINRFEARKSSDQQRKAIIVQRVAQLGEQIGGLEKQLIGVREQIKLLQQEATTVEEMVNKGYDRLPRLLGLKRSIADRTSAEGELMANVARARETIAEMDLQMAGVETQRIEQVEAELSETRAKRADTEELISKSDDQLSRSVIRAPANGIVLNARFKTVGGVVRPGETIMDIVPTDEKLVIDARVSIRDIDQVHEGLEAYVIFPSYPQRRLHRITGKVTKVSADALQDEKTGEKYFSAKVHVDPEHLRQGAPGIVLTPGLLAEVYVATTERTVLEYLVQPLMLAMERSMRED